jgi:hypothetical protein
MLCAQVVLPALMSVFYCQIENPLSPWGEASLGRIDRPVADWQGTAFPFQPL